jgi:hypothetical protein
LFKKKLKMKLAQDLWFKVQAQSGTNVTLTFSQDNTLALGAYRIDGKIIYHNSTNTVPASIFAVARLAVELFGAIMPRPDVIKLTPADWRDLKIEYKAAIYPLMIINRVPAQLLTWCWWHHFPTTAGTSFDYFAGMRNMAIDYKSHFAELMPAYDMQIHDGGTGTLGAMSKIDILHPDFPKVMYQKWLDIGKPAVFNCAETDNRNYWYLRKYRPAPGWFNMLEKEMYERALFFGVRGESIVGKNVRCRLDGKRYVMGKQADDVIAALFKQDTALNLTDMYIQAYKAMEMYFHLQGAYPRFKVYAYALYMQPPSNQWVDLSNFDVYYCGSKTTTREQVDLDVKWSLAWKATGCRFISRPNTLLGTEVPNPLLFADYLHRVKPHGFMQSTDYAASKNENIYMMFRAMQGVEPVDAHREYQNL